MFPSLAQDIQQELTQLAQHYGQPIVRTIDLETRKLFDPLNARDRYGEVCMVVRRHEGNLITMRKPFYPRGSFRLPTGGINFGESVLHALLRETYEETGLQVRVTRFLAALAYRVPVVRETPLFYTFAFLLDETDGTLGAVDETEQVEAFYEIPPKELLTLADFLDAVKAEDGADIHGNWEDWGHFRAAIHRAVAEALA